MENQSENFMDTSYDKKPMKKNSQLMVSNDMIGEQFIFRDIKNNNEPIIHDVNKSISNEPISTIEEVFIITKSNLGMKQLRFALILLTMLTLASCGGSDDGRTPELIIDPVVELEKPTATTTLTLSNMPVIDGSDSTEPL